MDGRTRIPWIDAAKGYGILLVLYGHFVLHLDNLGYAAAHQQSKLIYSFHMPLFFILAGCVAPDLQCSPGAFLVDRARRRLLPAALFNLATFLILISKDLLVGSFKWPTYFQMLSQTVQGIPAFHITSWFLVCLFTVEMLHYLRFRLFGPIKNLYIMSALYLIAGLIITSNLDFFAAFTGIAPNFWYIHEAVVVYSLYLLGMAIGPVFNRINRLWSCAGLVVSVLTLLLTYNLNQGPFHHSDIVNLRVSSHGNPALFVLTTLAGSISIMLLAQMSYRIRPISILGRYTLPLIGVDWLLIQQANGPLTALLSRVLPDTHFLIIATSCLVTILWVIIFAPVLPALTRLIGAITYRRPSLLNSSQ